MGWQVLMGALGRIVDDGAKQLREANALQMQHE